MDKDFIHRATKVSSFNLYAADFQSVRHKKEIQHLFATYFFPKFDLNHTSTGVDISKLNRSISDLKAYGQKENFDRIHNYNIKGIGPGEVTLYFLIDNAILGGGTSAGVDVMVGSSKYEVKAVQVNQQRQAYDFKLGGTIPMSDIISDLFALRKELKIAGAPNEINGSSMDAMRKAAPERMMIIENKYKKVTYEHYFKNHHVIFINNSKTQKVGNIEAIKQVKEKDITIERYTSNALKPRVQL
jgi:hypothetical protein